MSQRSRSFTAALALLPLLLAPGIAAKAARQSGSADKVIHTDHGPNALLQQRKHYVILVSLDGFRWDYVNKDRAKNLLAIAARGVSAPDGMMPSYPSLIFPNHYTLVTGLYPEHHGIVANRFYNAEHTKIFDYKDPATEEDGSWYGGTPLWTLAEQQGMRAACFFWSGCDADIGHLRPSYYSRGDGSVPDRDRVKQVLGWLRLPPDVRPHFIALSIEDVDRAGRDYGPDSAQTKAAVLKVDRLIGLLRAGLAKTGLPVDLIVVSDHGMMKQEQKWIDLDKYVDLSKLKTVGPLLYASNEADAQKAYDGLKSADADFQVYRRAHVPKELHYDSNPREGDPVIVATAAVAIRAHAPEAGETDKPPSVGADGFDPHQFPQMRAIFYAEGPDIERGVKLKPFENIDVYPFIADILGLRHPPVDGSGEPLAPAVRHRP